MSTQIASYYEIVTQLPEDASITFHDVRWDEYEELLEQVGEAPGLRITYDNGSLHAMTISSEHEKYAIFINSLIAGIRLRLRLNILAFGSATMRKPKRSAGHEPDACFYVQTAYLIGNRSNWTSRRTRRRISWWRSTCITTRGRDFESTRRSA